MKRATYHQIIDWKQRRGERPRLGIELVHQIDALQAEAASVADLSRTFLEFIPIRLVTILEVFIRGAVAELTNAEGEYFERGEKLAKGVKIDLAFAAHVNRQELTIGDFVAHAISLNSVDSVFSVLDTLLGNFVSKLKIAHSRWSEDEGDWPLPPIVEDYDAMAGSLTRLFEVRHILTHELPQEPVTDPQEVLDFIAAARVFISATDWVVVEALHGAVPRTQITMNIDAGNSMRREEERLAEVQREAAALGIDPDKLSALQEAWIGWAKSQAALVASQVEGGSMYPMMFASEMAVLTRERIDQLDRLMSEWLDS